MAQSTKSAFDRLLQELREVHQREVTEARRLASDELKAQVSETGHVQSKLPHDANDDDLDGLLKAVCGQDSEYTEPKTIMVDSTDVNDSFTSRLASVPNGKHEVSEAYESSPGKIVVKTLNLQADHAQDDKEPSTDKAPDLKEGKQAEDEKQKDAFAAGKLPSVKLGRRIRTKRTRLNRQLKDGGAEAEESLVELFRGWVLSAAFEKVTAIALISNAIFIGFQVEYSFKPEKPALINRVDLVYTVVFLVEVGARIWCEGPLKFFWGSRDKFWNLFDFSIVTLSTADTIISQVTDGSQELPLDLSVLRILRIIRLTRVLRIIRVLKFFRGLRILLSAIASTLKDAAFAFLLIAFSTYMSGIAIAQIVSEVAQAQLKTGKDMSEEAQERYNSIMTLFGSVGSAIMTMFITLFAGFDWKEVYFLLSDMNWFSAALYVIFIAFMFLCMMNVVTGIFCQSAIETTQKDTENVIDMQMREKDRYVNILSVLFARWDRDGKGKCTAKEFEMHMHDSETEALLKSLDIEVRDALNLFQSLSPDGAAVDLHDFVSGCITLRGGAKAVHMEKVHNLTRAMDAKFASIDGRLKVIETHHL